MPENKIRVASLFCGCGGSDLGLLGGFKYLGKHYKRLPFEIVYAIDNDKYAVETYNANFEHPAVCEDITKVDCADACKTARNMLCFVLIPRFLPQADRQGPFCLPRCFSTR